ncbi:hypothetical protein F5Y04DRAFT_243221 [Hypomontagnella monticulosa]|nr:hypothetical protein F5Y04DRAFT_243221 [Hypomontagnella monticulosa]
MSNTNIPEIAALHAKALAILRPTGRVPTRVEYGEALELADTAMDLAIEGGADAEVIKRCKAFQRLCYDPLIRAYSQTESFERVKYDKHTAKAIAKSRREGKIFDTDAGEHSVEAIAAAHVGKLLDEMHFDNNDNTKKSCKVRWVDEMDNRAITSQWYHVE